METGIVMLFRFPVVSPCRLSLLSINLKHVSLICLVSQACTVALDTWALCSWLQAAVQCWLLCFVNCKAWDRSCSMDVWCHRFTLFVLSSEGPGDDRSANFVTGLFRRIGWRGNCGAYCDHIACRSSAYCYWRAGFKSYGTSFCLFSAFTLSDACKVLWMQVLLLLAHVYVNTMW